MRIRKVATLAVFSLFRTINSYQIYSLPAIFLKSLHLASEFSLRDCISEIAQKFRLQRAFLDALVFHNRIDIKTSFIPYQRFSWNRYTLPANSLPYFILSHWQSVAHNGLFSCRTFSLSIYISSHQDKNAVGYFCSLWARLISVFSLSSKTSIQTADQSYGSVKGHPPYMDKIRKCVYRVPMVFLIPS